ncbi:2-hydroxyacid dehydrogenase [Actinoplanes friuliensis]|uniref:D-isomer specific 2-hydroxyacid dehydrogenase n=1 Tax=Actinoplanes friuliensis DSM 7358 TaxID=1246995 RepID=U5VZF3_9ACTN|nr:2-hydroxyacid dehydrogenase [Actinoplanes friuliensis]AGZ42147.1 D-isomer specific 2-hydroxyacid dehydrogenase [Actinoplanes friuliensis DSM 7358]
MGNSRLTVSLPSASLAEALEDVEAEVLRWDMSGPAPRPEIDLVVVPYIPGSEHLRWLDGVTTRLVQAQYLGYDGVAENLPPGHVYANARGVHETSTAELALALLLASQRGIGAFVRAAGVRTPEPTWYPSLADRRVLVLGQGGVGRAIEERLTPFEVEIVRVARTAREGVHGLAELPQLLPSVEAVVVAVPLTDKSVHLVGAEFLARLPDGAVVVNVARGRVADTAAILREARTGRLRFALDVTDPEPLPVDHELFTLPNVLISPHAGGMSTAMLPRVARLVRRQIELLSAGAEPVNVVLRR